MQLTFPNVTLSPEIRHFFSGSGSNPGQCIPLPSGAYVFNFLSSRMFPDLTLPLVTLAFVKATSQFPCSRSLTVGWPDIPSLPDSCLTSPAADQRLTSLSLPGKRMLSLSPAVPHFDHLIKVVPAAHLHYATGMSLGPSSTAVQGVLCGKVF